ncbi:MAG: hypothetical protein QN120_01875 [Armatimonadota bacterium]|nr:hypothetical protein [Armatimonadota bacterium]
MKAMLVAGAVALALLVISVAPALAAGPPWGPGPTGRIPVAGPRPGYGLGAGVSATIPADVREAIETAVRAAAARVLKMTPEEFEKERVAGRTLAALAAATNVPLGTVQTAMANARKFAINQALAAGRINKAQADALLRAGPWFGRASGPGQAPAMGPRLGMGPGFGPHPAMARRPGHMRWGVRRPGPGR